MFCYCTLYGYEDFGGNFTYSANGAKDCSGCLLPHRKESYGIIIERLREKRKLSLILKEGNCILEGKEETVHLLMEKAKEFGRIQKKQDFDSQIIVAIKKQFGSWPRALETLGLKETGQTYLNRQARR